MLTDAEIIELETLLAQKERSDAFNPHRPKANKNFTFLCDSFANQRYELNPVTKVHELVSGHSGDVLEGSSRSGKTISAIDFILKTCVESKKRLVIHIIKETYNEFKSTLYDDFQNRLNFFGLPNVFTDRKEVDSFKVGLCTIRFLGADKPSKFHGAGCDIAYYNEALTIAKAIFDEQEQRTRMFWIIDYNPSVTQHWIYENVLKRQDVGYLRTTFLDNPHLSIPERNKILRTEPWLPGSYTVEDGKRIMYKGKEVDEFNQPPPHPTNVEQGTADEFRWRVYGLGLRGAMKGLIFKNVKYIDKFPDYMAFSFGLDFGFTVDPTALVKCAEDEHNIYLELLLYQPVEFVDDLDSFFQEIGIDEYTPIIADSADKYTSGTNGTVEMVRDLWMRGYKILKVVKSKGVMYWLQSMGKKKIHIVKNHLYSEAKTEAENYRIKELNGIPINQPIDKFNHFWDASRYNHMSQFYVNF